MVDRIPVGRAGRMASDDQDEDSLQCRKRKESTKSSVNISSKPISRVGVDSGRIPPCSEGADCQASNTNASILNINAKVQEIQA